MSDTYIHGCPRSLSSNFRCEVWTPCPIVPNSPQFPLNSPSTPPQLPSVGCTMTGCQHLSVAPFSVKHFTRVHVCDKFPVLKKWRGQYVWLEILSPKFHRYDVEIFQLYFHLCFIWSRGHRFLEQRFTIAKHSEWGVYSLQDKGLCFSETKHAGTKNAPSCSHTYTSSWSVVSCSVWFWFA